MAIFTVNLPIPPRKLSPNARVHWKARRPVLAQYRDSCTLLMMAEGFDGEPMKKATVGISYRAERNHPMDPDNIIAMMKPAIDALELAKIVENDRHLTGLTVTWDHDPDDPGVLMVVSEA